MIKTSLSSLRKNIKYSDNGFTLIEMLFVLAVLSVILILSPPLHVSSIEKIQEQQFLSVLKSDILYTQNLTTTTEEYVRLQFYTDNYKIYQGVRPVSSRDYPTGITIDHRNNAVIAFHKTGTIISRRQIKIKTNNTEYHLIFPLGKGGMYINEI